MKKTKILQGAWRKGGLHSHTLWSDGRSLPERAIAAVIKNGFDFWCISEHCCFPDNPDAWREVCRDEGPWPPNLTDEEFAAAQNIVPGYPEVKPSNPWKKLARLMTFREMCKAFNKPDKFLLIPGSEFTPWLGVCPDGRNYCVHANWLNIPQSADLPPVKSPTAMLDKFYAAYQEAAGKSRRESCFMLNHPFWPYFDILSTDMHTRPEIFLAEICNGGPNYPAPDAMPSMEQWWDGANSFRIAKGMPCIYGTASDDTHFYDDDRAAHCHGGLNGGFVVIHLPGHMTANRIMRALKNGDFYASTGVFFDSIVMDYEHGLLKVKVRRTSGAKKCHIRFNGTKRGFDRTITTRFIPYETNHEFDRDVPVYSADVGQILAEKDGWTAEYKLAPDDMYVRATAVIDVPHERRNDVPDRYYPKYLTAWTQPMISEYPVK